MCDIDNCTTTLSPQVKYWGDDFAEFRVYRSHSANTNTLRIVSLFYLTRSMHVQEIYSSHHVCVCVSVYQSVTTLVSAYCVHLTN